MTKIVRDELFPCKNLFLNFNYTKSIESYLNFFNKPDLYNTFGISDELKIHGTIEDPDNSINFGFGDERIMIIKG